MHGECFDTKGDLQHQVVKGEYAFCQQDANECC
jgi:hypothetical protein